MAGAKRIKLSPIIDLVPPEIIEKILKLLNLRNICQAQLICKRWKEIVENGNLVKKAASKFEFLKFFFLYSIFFFNFRKNFLCFYGWWL